MFTDLLPLFSLSGHLARCLCRISAVGAGLWAPGRRHICLNDCHLQNTKVLVRSGVTTKANTIDPTQSGTVSWFLLFSSPKTAILGHIPGTGLHFDVEYEEVSSSEGNPVRVTTGLCKKIPPAFVLRRSNTRGSRFSTPAHRSTLRTATFMFEP